MAVTDKKRRMVTMPDGKQYPLMPKKKIPYTSTANTRAEAQKAVAQQQTPTPSVSPEAAAFAAGKVQNQQAYAAPKPTVNPYLDRDVAQQRAAMQAANNPSVSVNDKQGAYPNAEQFEKKYPYAHNLEQKDAAQKQVAAQQQAAAGSPIAYNKQGYTDAAQVEAMNKAILMQNAQRAEAQRQVAAQQAAESAPNGYSKQGYPNAEEIEAQNQAMLRQMAENADRDAAQKRVAQQQAAESRVMPNDKQGAYPTAEQTEANNQATLQQYADRAAAQEAINRGDSGTQQDYNMFANNKQQGYPSSETPTQTETPQQEHLQQQAQGVSQPTTQRQPALDPYSSTAGMDYLNSLYTDPKEEERLRKASVMNQRILAIGNALRHIGNIAYTVKGAPSMQFNDPVAEEQARYEKGKAMRDRANQQFYAYQRQKEAQDAAQRKWEQQFAFQQAQAAAQAAHRDRMATAAEGNAASLDAYRKRESARKEAADKDTKDYRDKMLKYKGRSLNIQDRNARANEKRASAYEKRANNAGRGKIVPLDTPNGKIVPSGGTPNASQMKQIYYAAKAIDERNKDERGRYPQGYKPLTSGLPFSWSGSKEEFDKVYEALSRNGELADWARDHLGWSYDTGAGSGMNLGLDGLEDEDDEMNLGLE